MSERLTYLLAISLGTRVDSRCWGEAREATDLFLLLSWQETQPNESGFKNMEMCALAGTTDLEGKQAKSVLIWWLREVTGDSGSSSLLSTGQASCYSRWLLP